MKRIGPLKIQKICINCCGLIGDVLIRTPFVEAVSKIYPHAKITAITDEGREELLNNHPNINNVITYKRNKKLRFSYIVNIIKFIRQLRKNKFDLIINLYGGGSSAVITKWSNAHLRLGFYRNDKEKKVYTYGVPWPEYEMSSQLYHWGQQFGLLLKPFSVFPKDLLAGVTFIPTTEAQEKAHKIIAKVNRPWVLMNMGAGDTRKLWNIDNFVSTAIWLHDSYGYHIGVFVNPGQEHLAKKFSSVAEEQKFASFSLLDVMDFSTIGALMQRANFIITGDTGLMHIAIGVKSRVLTLFTHTRPEAVMPRDVLLIPCFIEDTNKLNQYGVPMAIEDLSLDYVKNKIVDLHQQL